VLSPWPGSVTGSSLIRSSRATARLWRRARALRTLPGGGGRTLVVETDPACREPPLDRPTERRAPTPAVRVAAAAPIARVVDLLYEASSHRRSVARRSTGTGRAQSVPQPRLIRLTLETRACPVEATRPGEVVALLRTRLYVVAVDANRGRSEKPEPSGVVGFLHPHEPHIRVEAEFRRDPLDKLACGVVVRAAVKVEDLHERIVRHGSRVAARAGDPKRSAAEVRPGDIV